MLEPILVGETQCLNIMFDDEVSESVYRIVIDQGMCDFSVVDLKSGDKYDFLIQFKLGVKFSFNAIIQ